MCRRNTCIVCSRKRIVARRHRNPKSELLRGCAEEILASCVPESELWHGGSKFAGKMEPGRESLPHGHHRCTCATRVGRRIEKDQTWFALMKCKGHTMSGLMNGGWERIVAARTPQVYVRHSSRTAHEKAPHTCACINC